MTDRDLRLDLIRVIAIVGVVNLHIVGGVADLNLGLGNRILTDLILAISQCSVNLFALLTGYLKIDRTQHHSSIIKILVETVFLVFGYRCYWCSILRTEFIALDNEKFVSYINR